MKPVTIVSGFGRCGTSMVMQMLDAGGMPTVCKGPIYEPEDMMTPEELLRPAYLKAAEGKAIKVLDIQRGRIPTGLDFNLIWMDRDAEEQAESQAKFLKAMCGFTVSRENRRAMQRSYPGDRVKAMQMIKAANPRALIEVRFETALLNPHAIAERIASHIEGLDPFEMAKVVIPRSPRCMPDMRLEMMLMEHA
jgi:hypothetical protein